MRLYIVVLALGFPDVELGLSGAIFVALIGSLLTAIPLSPAGLGFAQAGVIGVLTVAYGVPLPEATAITILDWVISVLSIIVFGAIVYVVSPMPRGMGRIPQPPVASRPRPPPEAAHSPISRIRYHRADLPSVPVTTDVPRSGGRVPVRPDRTTTHRTRLTARAVRCPRETTGTNG